MAGPKRLTLPSGLQVKFYFGASARLACGLEVTVHEAQTGEDIEPGSPDYVRAASNYRTAICASVIEPRIVPDYPAPEGALWYEELTGDDVNTLVLELVKARNAQDEKVRPTSAGQEQKTG